MMMLLAIASPARAAEEPVTFNTHIAPLVWTKCATCHRPGQVAPFSLITYDDLKRRAALIGTVTARRIMPPWKAVAGKGDFANVRALSDAEIDLVQRWVDAGAPEGRAADHRSPPDWTGAWQLGAPDLVVTMREPFTVPADGGDVFRTFVLPIATDRPRYVRALEFRPDNPRVVHHANIGVDRTRSSRRLDGRDGQPGYVGGMVQDARYPEGQLLGWTPGQVPQPVAAGMQWRLEPRSDLVVQLHLQPTGRTEALKVSVGIYLTDEPPSRTPLGLRLGSQTIDIPPGERQYIVHDAYTLPVDVDVLALQPHAHYLARRMDATATLPDGAVVPLIEIDDWDFRWQDVYRYRAPLALPKGTRVEMRYIYDNSADNPRNPRHPPERVVWGQNTTDEMGDLWIQVVARDPSDSARLGQDFRRKANADDLAAYTKLLKADPENPLRHDAVASLAFEGGRVDEAIEHYRRSLELNPSAAATHYNIAIAYSARGRRADAMAHFEEAIRIDPEYAQAHNNLGALLSLAGRAPDAIAHFRRAIALRPEYVDAHTNLAALLSTLGQPAEAIREYWEALAIRPDHPAALAGLAWVRATAWDASLRDGDEAVTCAERAAAATSYRDLSVLDALAAAYATVGKFDEAVKVASAAMAQATAASMLEVAARFRERAALYRQQRPYRVPPAK